MLTLLERETRVVEFLRTLFPTHTVVPSLLGHDDARRRGATRLPEIRVSAAGSGEGLLRWRLEVLNGDLTSEAARRAGIGGLLPSLQRLHDALSLGAADRPWRHRSALTAGTGPPDRCEVILEEAWTPEHASPQMLFTIVVIYGYVEQAALPAGTNVFEPVVADGAGIQIGSHVLAWHDAEDIRYLGRAASVSPTLTTELPLLHDMPAPVFFHGMAGEVTAPEAAVEEESVEMQDSRRLDFNLQGLRRQTLLAPPRRVLTLRWPLLTRDTVREWQRYLAAQRPRASMLLVRCDRSIVEASLDRVTVTSPSGAQPLVMELRFLIGPVVSLTPFTEVLS